MFKLKKLNFADFTDERLMLAMQHGECAVFEELYKRYNERLYYYFYRMISHEHSTAEDFTQDLFMKLIQKPHLFDSGRCFATWIFSIAHNMCKNEYRSRKVRSITIYDENPDSFCDNNEAYANTDLDLKRIFTELDKLDASHKTAFLLKYREGFSIEEISEIMELPEGTVKSRLFYARKKLKQQLTQDSTY